VGIPANKLVLGKHSGRHALVRRLKEFGYNLNPAEIENIFSRFKDLADKKKCIFDDDIIALAEEGISGSPRHTRLSILTRLRARE